MEEGEISPLPSITSGLFAIFRNWRATCQTNCVPHEILRESTGKSVRDIPGSLIDWDRPRPRKPRRTLWLIAGILAALTAAIIVGVIVGGSILRKRFEPYIREQAVIYLQKRFDSKVELASLYVRIPPSSPAHALLTRGRGTLARVDGSGLIVRWKGRTDVPPVLAVRKFTFYVDLGAVFDSPKVVSQVVLDGMKITIPPKEDSGLAQTQGRAADANSESMAANVDIREMVAHNSEVVVMPKIRSKMPLLFDIAYLRLDTAGRGLPMKYDAVLTNPKPAGLIHSNGNFGPWSTAEPGDTPLSGNYSFDHGDLGSFSAISGILNSTGDFAGSISAITAKGRAFVPDFRLKSAGHPVPLSANFEVLVDGGNGNTILKPVRAKLGNTQFTTSGGVIKRNGDLQRSIALDVTMPAGNLTDLLRLAMRDAPLMEGQIALRSRIVIPPLTRQVKDKLILDGQLRISSGKFLRSAIQSKIDSLSRRGQGEPGNEEISQVFSRMMGDFRMENQSITFRSLTFATPGAGVNLTGTYNLADDTMDFHGSLGLDARVSQTMKGWKRWALKPVDPFFAKNGVGTFLRIRIDGSSKSPHFGLDHRKQEGSKE